MLMGDVAVISRLTASSAFHVCLIKNQRQYNKKNGYNIYGENTRSNSVHNKTSHYYNPPQQQACCIEPNRVFVLKHL